MKKANQKQGKKNQQKRGPGRPRKEIKKETKRAEKKGKNNLNSKQIGKEIKKAESNLWKKQNKLSKQIARLRIKLDNIKARFENKINKVEEQKKKNEAKISEAISLLLSLKEMVGNKERKKGN